ncbi:hypothetical protein C0993_006869 [Termitomyces sp. T159_Od127]|nr:hypothetical protein C0993_006869 [Termitomyces sp. T159_Od127]
MDGEAKPWLAEALMGSGQVLHIRGSREDWSELGEDTSGSKGEGLALAPVIRMGPPHGKQRPLVIAWSKWQASPSLEAGPSKRPWGDVSLVGPAEPHIFFPTLACLQPLLQKTMEQSLLVLTVELCWRLQEAYKQLEQGKGELMVATMDRNRAQRDQDMALAAVREHEAELVALWVQMAKLESKMVTIVPEEEQVVRVAWAAEWEAI